MTAADPLLGTVLAMDAASGPGTIAVLRGGTVLAEATIEMRSMGEERCFPAVLATLDRAGVPLPALDAILVGAGPGSFTALRVIGAIAKGLAEGRGIPLFAVPSLALTPTPVGTTSVRLDALRGEYYLARLQRSAGGGLTEVESLGCRPASACGEAVDATPHAREAPAALALARRDGAVDLPSWEPRYGREAEAQTRWEATHGRELRDRSLAVRQATREDLVAIHAIEATSFPDPWSLESFEESLADATDTLTVALRADAVVGYAVLRVLGPEAELLNLAVHPAHRRHGVADALLADALRRIDAGTRATVHLEVREGNLAAQALYRRHGFLPVGRRRGYYADPPEDALLMRRAAVGAASGRDD